MAGQAVIEIGGRQWAVSLAIAPEELVLGLGGLASIPPGTGMLFDMGKEQPIQVTTAPMLFAIDIVFFDSFLATNGLARDVAPGILVTTEADASARFFLEVNAGETAGIHKGQRAVLSQVLLAGQAPTAQPVPPVDQAVSLAAWLLTLGLASGLLQSLAQGLFGSRRKAGGETILPHVIATEKQGGVTQDFLDDLQGLLDEDKKTESLKKLETALGKLTPGQRRSTDGLEDLEQAIRDYKGITRQGLTPEEYIGEKESAWSDIEDALDNLSLWDEDEEPGTGTEPKTLPATFFATSRKPPAASQSNRHVVKQVVPPEVEFFADSADHCCGSLDRSGLRPQMERAFLTAIARVKGG